jgi:hypothetical protein
MRHSALDGQRGKISQDNRHWQGQKLTGNASFPRGINQTRAWKKRMVSMRVGPAVNLPANC